jgi:hypothetical protein
MLQHIARKATVAAVAQQQQQQRRTFINYLTNIPDTVSRIFDYQ